MLVLKNKILRYVNDKVLYSYVVIWIWLTNSKTHSFYIRSDIDLTLLHLTVTSKIVVRKCIPKNDVKKFQSPYYKIRKGMK